MILAITGTAVAVALGITLARWLHTRVVGWLPEDDPGTSARKRHARPTPLVGFVPALACVGVLSWQDLWFAAGATMLGVLVGFIDDRGKDPATLGDDEDRDRGGGGLRARTKGLWLAVAVAILSAPHLLMDGSHGEPDWPNRMLAFGLVFVTGFVLVNATNFLDNTNGVSAALTAFALLWIGTPESLVCAGAWLGYLPFNWPRGRVFLGDSGAFGAGLVLAALSLPEPGFAAPTHQGGSVWWLALAPTALFFLDFVQVVCARLALGYAPWIGDRRHLTHIAQNAGVPAAWVAPIGVLAAAALALVITRLAA